MRGTCAPWPRGTFAAPVGGAKPHNRFLATGRRELDPCPGAPMLRNMSEHQGRPSLEIRVTALEWEVRQLRGELIRAKTAGERPTSPMPPFAPVVEGRLPTAPPPAFSETPGPSLEPRRSPAAAVTPGVDLETLVGRYGIARVRAGP